MIATMIKVICGALIALTLAATGGPQVQKAFDPAIQVFVRHD